jgi:type II secretory pathway component GspD/PulD (secretin)
MKRIIFIVSVVLLNLVSVQAEDKIIFKSDVIFSKDTYKEDIKNILKEIAKKNEYQIQFDESVEGKETFDFNMPLEGAFNMVMRKYKLNYKVEGKVIMVTGVNVKKKIIVLNYLKADKLKKILKRYDIIDKSLKRVVFGKGNMDNTVLVEGKTDVIAELETLIGKLEKAEELKKAERELRKEEKEKKDALKLAEKERQEKAELEKRKIKLDSQKEVREAELAKKQIELNKQQEARKLKELRLEQNKAELNQKIKEQRLSQNDILFNNQLSDLSRKMEIDVIPLKYINVSKSEIEFQGKKIQIESLEDTLNGLLGTNYVDGNYTYLKSGRESAFLKIDQRTNSIIIKDFPERIMEVKQIIAKLDKQPKLIEIEVTIAMGNSGFTQELGLKLGGGRKYNGRDYGVSTSENIAENLNQLRTTATTQSSTTSNGAVSSTESSSINNSFQTTELLQPIGALGLSSSMLFLGGKSMLNIQLNAMENEGLGKVLSNPRIITLNNREATILSGDSVSIPTATVDKMSLETVETGISIRVKPHVVSADNEDEEKSEILLDISIEKSSLGLVSREKIETSQSTVNSSVLIRNGKTLILGGLFQYTKSGSEGGVPLLKDIPLLGLLFQTKNKTLHKNELLFFITPRIISKEVMDNMQNNSYMSYKKNLKFHKKMLAKSLGQIDRNIETPSRSNLKNREPEVDFFANDEDFNF